MKLRVIKGQKTYDPRKRKRWEARYIPHSIRAYCLIRYVHYKWKFFIWFHLVYNDVKTRLTYKFKNTVT
jgi:hypothetical protein